MATPKDHAFYQAKADYWNQRLFACHKVANFYLRHRDEMQSRTYSAHIHEMLQADKQAVVCQAELRESAQAQARMQDLDRLHTRKQGRCLLERACRPGSALKPQPPLPPQRDCSLWERLEELPVSQLKKFISRKQLELDRRNPHIDATETIKARAKSRPPSCVEGRQEQNRVQLMQRHAQLAQLETRSGVRKHRELRSLTPTPFGTTHSYATPHLFSRLSQSRETCTPDSAYELRGLLHVDYPGVVSKLAGSSVPCQPLQPQARSLQTQASVSESEQIRLCMKEMDDFDSREKPPSAASQLAFQAMIRG